MLFTVYTHFIKVEYQQNSDIVNDVIGYLLCAVLSNELLLSLVSKYVR